MFFWEFIYLNSLRPFVIIIIFILFIFWKIKDLNLLSGLEHFQEIKGQIIIYFALFAQKKKGNFTPLY